MWKLWKTRQPSALAKGITAHPPLQARNPVTKSMISGGMVVRSGEMWKAGVREFNVNNQNLRFLTIPYIVGKMQMIIRSQREHQNYRLLPDA